MSAVLSVDAWDRVGRVAALMGTSKVHVLDALLRSLPDAELVRIVGERTIADGEARAAWSRSRR